MTKTHPSVIIYRVASREDAEVIVSGTVEYVGPSPDAYASARSEGLWQVDLVNAPRPRRTPRQSEWEW